ncbi:MAG: alpha/beta hydrolase [Thermosynechococcaceae cyanobacterium]
MSNRQHFLSRLVLGTLAALTIALPAWSAEKVYFKFGSLEVSLSVQSLETWVETGKVDPELAGYIEFLQPQQRARLLALLQTKYDEDFFNLSYMTYTSIGERFLNGMNQFVRTKGQDNGIEDLRIAFVNASKADGGLSFVNVLQQYPNDIEIDVDHVINMLQRAKRLVAETDRFMTKLETVADAEVKGPPPSGLDLRQPGAFKTTMQSLKVGDLDYDLYRPLQQSSPAPVIVITAGFAAQHDFFKDLADHLASYGFAVAIPDHAGSNNIRRHSFFQGKYKELFEATEYVNRPREVTAVLDDLEQRPEFQNQFNVKNVGVFSHSFGGATALSLAGANLNFKLLEQSCGDDLDQLNISLYYQCHALRLPQPVPSLKDDRIKSLFLLGPFSKALFGEHEIQKLDLPVFWEATNIDIPAPLLQEQIPIFKTLTIPDRYLAVSKGLPHAHISFEVLTGLVKENEVETLQALSMTYQKAMTLAFFKTYTAGDQTFRPYLQTSYAKSISEAPHLLFLLDAEASKRLF